MRRLALVWTLALAAWTAMPGISTAQPERTDVERQVKAAYLYKFGGFVEWPERAFNAPDSPIRIGVIGAPQLADELNQMIAGRTVNGRSITVQKMRLGEPLAGINVLFVGASQNERLAEILSATRGLPILTVTESNDGLSLGSIINFVLVDGKLRFEIAPKTANQGNLNISARLLAAAFKVSGAL